jgi:hypothetical protein
MMDVGAGLIKIVAVAIIRGAIAGRVAAASMARSLLPSRNSFNAVLSVPPRAARCWFNKSTVKDASAADRESIFGCQAELVCGWMVQ